MNVRDTLTSTLARLTALACVAIAFFSADADPLIRIATGDSAQVGVWKAFEDYLNERLEGDCQVQLVPSDADKALVDLNRADVQGAILSPFRYVVADLRIPNLEFVARMRRGGVIQGKKGFPDETSPVRYYHSIVLIAVNASEQWPPTDPNHPVAVSFSDYRSTSEYIFPFAHFSDKGYFDMIKPLPRSPSVPEGHKEEAWQIPDTWTPLSGSADDQYRDTLEQIKDHRAPVQVLTSSDHKFNAFVPAEERTRFYRQLFRSGDIPFDAVVIRTDGISRKVIKSIRRAFLSTRDMSETERNECFKPMPMVKQEPLTDKQKSKDPQSQYWQRQPDIHDFIEGRDRDYDGVREAATKAFGGRVVHIAISLRVHRDEDWDAELLRSWMKDVFRNTVDKNITQRKGGSEDHASVPVPVFIDVQPRDTDFKTLLNELENRKLDAAELNAATAALAVGRKTGALIGKAVFDGNPKYYFVMLAAKDTPTAREKIDENLKFAYTSEDSSSGYQYPLIFLKELRKNPPPSRWVKGVEAAGVVDLLMNKGEKALKPFADYGFLASFEWKNIQEQWNRSGLDKIHEVKLEKSETAIPNAYLVFSRASAPDIDVLGSPSAAHKRALFPLVSGPLSTPPPLASSIISSLRENLPKAKSSEQAGFDGYQPTDNNDVKEMADLYNRYGNDPVRDGVLMLIILVAFLGIGLGFTFKRRGLAPEAPFSIQSLSDVLKGLPAQDRRAQQAVTTAVKQLSKLRTKADFFAKNLDAAELAKLQTSLESSLLGLLTLHDKKRSPVDDGQYETALGKLKDATADTERKLQPLMEAAGTLEQPNHHSTIGDITGIIKSVLEIISRIIGSMKG